MRTILLLAVTAGLVTSSCVNLKKVQAYDAPRMEVEDRYLVRSGSDILVDLLIDIPEEYTNCNTGLVVTPFIKGAFDTLYLPPFVVEGTLNDRFNERQQALKPERADNAEVRFRYHKEGTQVNYSTKAPYQKWMDHGVKLYAGLTANAYTKEIPLGTIPVYGGILDLGHFITFEPIEKYYYSASEDATVLTERSEEPDNGFALFSVGSARPQLNRKESEAISAFFNRMLDNPAITEYGVLIEVSNSPEGALTLNQELGQARINAVKDHLLSIGVPGRVVTSTLYEEGWDDLLAALPYLDIENRAGIEQLIGTVSDLDEREQLIREKYPEDYKVLVNEVYPTLRYARVTISTPDASGHNVYTHTLGGPAAAVQNPFFTVSADNGEDIYTLNAQMLDAVRADNYERALQLAARIPNNSLPEFIYSNKGILMLKTDRPDEAAALLERAPGIPEARYNLALLQLLDGEYEKACENFCGYTDMNAAVAALYCGKDTEAARMILLLPPSAERDYLLAMAYARLDRDADAARMLSGSVGGSDLLKSKAKTEPDFNSAANESQFRAILK